MVAKEMNDLKKALSKVMADLPRMQVLAVMIERPASAKEIAGELDQPASKVRYHLRSLLEAGIIESSKEERRRGVVERFYRPAFPPLLEARETASLNRAERRRVSLTLSRVAFEDVTASLGSGVFDDRPNRTLHHTRLRVDPEGWSEIQRIHEEALAKVLEAKRRAEERLQAEEAAEEIRAASIFMCFELPAKAVKGGGAEDAEG